MIVQKIKVRGQTEMAFVFVLRMGKILRLAECPEYDHSFHHKSVSDAGGDAALRI